MWRRWIWVAGYVGVIFALSSIPNLSPPSRVEHADKAAHFLEYFILGTLLVRAWMGSGGGRSSRRAWFLAVAVGALIAALDELYQGTVGGRQRSAADWAADVVGLTAGGGVVARGWLDRLRHRIPVRTKGENP